jgi:predicted nucleotidyltransferase
MIYLQEPISPIRVAKELKLSKGLISKFFDILISEKVLTKSRNKVLVQNNVYTKAIKIMLILNSFNPDLFKKYKFIKGVGLYGSCAKGTNIRDSDIDLWIKIEKTKEAELAKLTNELKRKYEKIKPIFLTKEKINILKEKDAVFYYSLALGSIVIYGEEIEV